MLIYYILYSFFGISTVIVGSPGIKDKERAQKTSFVICIIALILLFGLRHPSMGNDLHYGMSNGYLGSFMQIGHYSWKSVLSGIQIRNYEYGFILFNKIIYSIYPHQQALLLGCAVVSWSLLGYTIYKNTDSPIMSLVIYMGLPSLLMMFSGLRQTLAFSIAAFSFNFIKEKKPIKFIITVLVAWLFHSSAFFFLVAYPCYYIKRTRFFKIFTVIGIPMVYVFRYPLYFFFGRLFKEDVKLLETPSFTLMIVFYLIYIFCMIFSNDDDKEESGLLNLFSWVCIFQMFASVSCIAMRMGYYFMIFLALLLPKTFKNVKSSEKERELIQVFTITIFILYGIHALKTSTWACSNPYHFFREFF